MKKIKYLISLFQIFFLISCSKSYNIIMSSSFDYKNNRVCYLLNRNGNYKISIQDVLDNNIVYEEEIIDYKNISICLRDSLLFSLDKFSNDLKITNIFNNTITHKKVKDHYPNFTNIVCYDNSIFLRGYMYGVYLSNILSPTESVVYLKSAPKSHKYSTNSIPLDSGLNLFSGFSPDGKINRLCGIKGTEILWQYDLLLDLENQYNDIQKYISISKHNESFVVCYNKSLFILNLEGKLISRKNFESIISNHFFIGSTLYINFYDPNKKGYFIDSYNFPDTDVIICKSNFYFNKNQVTNLLFRNDKNLYLESNGDILILNKNLKEIKRLNMDENIIITDNSVGQSIIVDRYN